MTLHRFFGTRPMTEPGELPLTEADVHHLRDVLRLVVGDEVVVVAAGEAIRVRLTDTVERVAGEPLGPLRVPRLPRVTLVQGLAKGDKMDDIVRQTTELGIARIIPFASDRTVVKLTPAKAAERVSRWRRIAAEAAKQSQRADIPLIADVVGLDGVLAAVIGSSVVVCWEDACGASGIGDVLRDVGANAESDVALVVGPEGGLTQAEVDGLTGAGGAVASMGATVLRTETAGVVACALAMYALGGLGADCGR